MQRSTDPLLARLLARLAQELPRAVGLRHRLHERPELARAEHQTAALIAEELPVACTAVAGSGRLALVGAGALAPVAIRAELDGLPLKERTRAPFKASGETMHACGHDVHMAALVALVRAAAGLDQELPSPLLAIFQPSEEVLPSGAEQLVRELPSALRPAAVVGAHIHPELPWGAVSLDAGTVNASSDSVLITVEGEPTHGAYPHHGRDPVLALAQIVLALHAQVGRRIDPLHPALVNVGVLEAAGAENIVPARARARASLRAYRREDRASLRALAEEVVVGIAAAHGCRGAAELIPGEPALENDARMIARGRELSDQAGFLVAREWRSCGSDDFAFFGELAPLAMGFVGLDGAPGFERRPLHHPELLPPDEAVGAVARAQALLYVAAVEALPS